MLVTASHQSGLGRVMVLVLEGTGVLFLFWTGKINLDYIKDMPDKPDK